MCWLGEGRTTVSALVRVGGGLFWTFAKVGRTGNRARVPAHGPNAPPRQGVTVVARGEFGYHVSGEKAAFSVNLPGR